VQAPCVASPAARGHFSTGLIKCTRSKKPPLRPDGRPMTDDDFRELHDQFAAFNDIQWIDGDVRDARTAHFIPPQS